ncbi:MAG: hypothetical protein JNM10_01500 [Planctomycetia bacterium]|nr:hypothetical protein [Planctomycetia bacterium]
MARRSRPLRALVAVLAGVLALVAAVAGAGRAAAEEALVLDNGAILRGTVVREDPDALVLRLSGVGSDAKVTVERRRIVQRFVTVETTPTPPPSRDAAPPPLPLAEPARVVAAPVLAATVMPALPEEEPRAAEETFLQRSKRRAAMALPTEPGPRAFLAAAALLVVLCLVGLAAKMADVESASLGKTTLLAFLFCGMVTITWSWSDMFARADRATVLIPIQLLAWVGLAAAVLRCGLGRAFHLLAFVLVSAALVVFSAGVVLVSV